MRQVQFDKMQTIRVPTRVRHRRWVALAFAVATTMTGFGTVGAKDASSKAPTRQISPREISVEQAVQRVQQQTSGKVLSVQVVTMGKHKLYRIKVLTPDGQMRVVQVPAEE